MKNDINYMSNILVKTEGTINRDVGLETLASAVIFNACKEYKRLYSKYLKYINKEKKNPIKFNQQIKNKINKDICKHKLDEVVYFLKYDDLYWPFISSTDVRDKVYLKLKAQIENDFKNKFAK